MHSRQVAVAGSVPTTPPRWQWVYVTTRPAPRLVFRKITTGFSPLPRYKFRWTKLPPALLKELSEQLVAGGEDPADALTQVYGARPKDDFVQEAWSILRERWLAHSRGSRNEVVLALRDQRREGGAISNRRAQLEYLRSLRNTKGLRDVALQKFISFGEVDHDDRYRPICPPNDVKSRVGKPLQPKSGGGVLVSTKNPKSKTSEDDARHMQQLSPSSTAVPEVGQIVSVRGANWAVTDVHQQSLPSSAHDDAIKQLQHAVNLQSVEDDRLGDELRVVWELEPGRSLRPPQDLPTHIDPDKFDAPERLAAFIDALRWGAVTSADVKTVQAPFRSGAKVEPYQLEPLMRALSAPRANLLLADDVGLGKTIEAGLVIQELLLRHRARTVIVVCPAGLCAEVAGRDAREVRLRLQNRELGNDERC